MFAFFSPVIAAEPLFSLVSFFHPKMKRGFRLKFKALHFTAQNSGQIHYRGKKWNMSKKAFFKCQAATQFSFMFILTRSTPWAQNFSIAFLAVWEFYRRQTKPFFIASLPHTLLHVKLATKAIEVPGTVFSRVADKTLCNFWNSKRFGCELIAGEALRSLSLDYYQHSGARATLTINPLNAQWQHIKKILLVRGSFP